MDNPAMSMGHQPKIFLLNRTTYLINSRESLHEPLRYLFKDSNKILRLQDVSYCHQALIKDCRDKDAFK